jgi:peptidoglycan/LPS O-acetylase OafA/YrhL
MTRSLPSKPGIHEPREVLKHIGALDGVRGLAILLVLLFHLLWSNSETGSRLGNFLVGLRGAGWVGVDLFYSLSGFLITGILFDSLHGRHYFRNFYARRALRIVPLYYGVITILLVFIYFHLPTAGVGRTYALLVFYLNNTPLWWHTTGGQPLIYLTDHLWSLAVEEQFYLVWPFVIFAIRDRKKLLWTALLLALMAPVSRTIMLSHGADLNATYKMTICRADSLLGGAWLALVMRGSARERVLKFAPFLFWLGLCACGLIAWKTSNFDFEVNRTVNLVGYSFVAIASTSFIAMALRPGGAVVWTMSFRWLRFLGKYSYGIYVLHMPVLAAKLLVPTLQQHIHSKAVFHLATSAIVMAVTIPLAMLSYKFYEQPFLSLKSFFNYAKEQTPRAVASV